ncbi:MAG: adenylate kinase family protein [Fervidicoccaceae archaeon]|jgi:adenylate kinase|uniref:Adenylate kinase n=1 Tax=Fervidicoccus fontis TaxID=683846 RepID=A0A7C1E359_9CREN|nr:adenylate kinase family protein [Fervidicoccaceae archaeon]
MIIIVSGTPGTGKSEITNGLCSLLNAYCLSASRVAIESDLVIARDFVRDTYIVDEQALESRIDELVRGKELVIIESLDPCLLKDKSSLIVVTRCSSPEILEDRMRKRGWRKEKIEENIEAEVLGVIEEQALSCKEKDRVIVVDTCAESIENIIKRISSFVSQSIQ